MDQSAHTAPQTPAQVQAVHGPVTVHTHLAQAQLLLAETQLRCRDLLLAARGESDEIIAEAREVAYRIIADARAQTTGTDTRERSVFSQLWENAQDDSVDGFFLSIPERTATDIYNP
jgi:regulator of protease activity HflC (stomatin/prohibitin superfamily)